MTLNFVRWSRIKEILGLKRGGFDNVHRLFPSKKAEIMKTEGQSVELDLLDALETRIEHILKDSKTRLPS